MINVYTFHLPVQDHIFSHFSSMQFIQVSEGQFSVTNKARALLSSPAYQAEGGLSVVSVVGTYRSGKSFLLNQIAQQDGMFQTSPTTNAQTRGIWVSRQLLSGHILVMDTEGISSTDSNANHDTAIFALAILLSSLCLYNNSGPLTSSSLNDLQLAGKVASLLKNHSKFSSATHAPRLGIVLRDFRLRMVSNDPSQSVDPNTYLETSLHKLSPELAASLKSLFPERDLLPVPPPPSVDEDGRSSDLQALYHTGADPWSRGIRSVVQYVHQAAARKHLNGMPLSGKMLVNLADAMCAALNQGGMPSLDGVWSLLSERQCRVALDHVQAVASASRDQLVESESHSAVFKWVQTLNEAYTSKLFEASTPAQRSQLDQYLDQQLRQLDAAKAKRQSELVCAFGQYLASTEDFAPSRFDDAEFRRRFPRSWIEIGRAVSTVCSSQLTALEQQTRAQQQELRQQDAKLRHQIEVHARELKQAQSGLEEERLRRRKMEADFKAMLQAKTDEVHTSSRALLDAQDEVEKLRESFEEERRKADQMATDLKRTTVELLEFKHGETERQRATKTDLHKIQDLEQHCDRVSKHALDQARRLKASQGRISELEALSGSRLESMEQKDVELKEKHQLIETLQTMNRDSAEEFKRQIDELEHQRRSLETELRVQTSRQARDEERARKRARLDASQISEFNQLRAQSEWLDKSRSEAIEERRRLETKLDEAQKAILQLQRDLFMAQLKRAE